MPKRVLPILPIEGVPEQLIQALNSRFRGLEGGGDGTGTGAGKPGTPGAPGPPGPSGGGTLPAPPAITVATATPLYQRYGNLWRIGFQVGWTAPANPSAVPYNVLVQKLAPGTPPTGGSQATIDTVQGPFAPSSGYGLASDFSDSLNASASETWHVILTPINTDGLAAAPMTVPVTFNPPALTSVSAVSEIGPRSNVVPDDPTAAGLRGLNTTIQFKVQLAFNPGADPGFNPGGGPGVQQIRAWLRYDRGTKKGDGTAVGVETILLGSLGIAGSGLPGTTFQIPYVWVSTANMSSPNTLKVICAIWVSDSMPPPAEDSTNTGSFPMDPPAIALPTAASVDSISYWTIPGGYAWGFHTITFTCPFDNPNFKAAELTVQKYSNAGIVGDITTPATVAPDYEGIERNFAGSEASRTPFLNISVSGNTVKVTLLTAWTMPSKNNPDGTVNVVRRYVIRIYNVRQDDSKTVVSCWGTGTAPTDCTYKGDRLEIIPNLANAELTATAFDPSTIGQGLYVDDTGDIVENTGYNPSNMLPNSSFEDGALGTYSGSGAAGPGLPSGWKPAPSQSGSIALVGTPTLTGQQAVQLKGTHSQITNRQVIFCRAGDSFYFELWTRSDGTSDGSQLRMAFFFFDAAGTFLFVPFKDNANPGTTWTKCFWVATAPAGCTSFAVDFGTTGGSNTTNWYVDNVLCRPNNAGAGGNTNGLIQADANGNLIVNTDGNTLGTAAGFVDVAGTAVTWRSGAQFGGSAVGVTPAYGMTGSSILISGVTYTVTGVTDTTHLTISSSAGTQTNAAYSIGSVVLIPAGVVKSNNLFTGTLSDFSKYDTTNRAIGITFGPPSLPNSNYPQGSMFFNLADGKVYRNAGGALSVSNVTVAGSTVLGQPNGKFTFTDITGGGGTGGSVVVQLDANGRATTGVGNSSIAYPGSGYTGNFTYVSAAPNPVGYTIVLTTIVTPPTGPPITGLWPNTPWVVASAAQDIFAGTLAAQVAYIGTINANQVNAGIFNGMQLMLSLNGVNTSINHATDPVTSRAYCYKSDDGAGGHVALVDPTGFSVYRGPSPGGSGNPVSFWAQNNWFMGEGSAGSGRNFVQIESQTVGGKITVNDPSSGKIVLDFSATGSAPSILLIDPAGNNMRITTTGIFKNGAAYTFP